MHLVLRSSKARGDWSFKRQKHEFAIESIIQKFAKKYGVKIFAIGNAGNHLHLHIKLFKREMYKPFIRAVTSAIAVFFARNWMRSTPPSIIAVATSVTCGLLT